MSPLDQALNAAVRISTPLLFAGLGEMVLERSGLINVGIEGVMLMGAFGGFCAACFSGSRLLGAPAVRIPPQPRRAASRCLAAASKPAARRDCSAASAAHS